jgi:hypothetical protein
LQQLGADFVTEFGLTIRVHTHSYYIHWLNNNGKAKITHTVYVYFSIGTYDYVDCDVVPMQSCSLLLGCPWEFDTDVVHHGRSNKYTLVHNEKKITFLLALTPNEIMQCDRAIAKTAKCDSKIQHDQPAPPSSSHAIKLKSHALLATKSEIFVPAIVDAPFHALMCRQVLFSLDDITIPLSHTITNLLQEFKDVFPADIPTGLPQLRGIKHQIDLTLGETFTNHAAYRTNPEETKEI